MGRRLQPAPELVERSANEAVIDPLLQEPVEHPQGYRLESGWSIDDGISGRQKAVTSPQNPTQSIFLGNDPTTLNVHKRKISSGSPSESLQTPKSKRRTSSIPLVPLENVDRKVMPVTERLSRRTVSQETVPRFVAAASRKRGSSASASIGVGPTAFTKTSPKKRTTAKGVPYRTPPRANAATNSVATNKEASNNTEVAGTKPQGFNSAERIRGVQALQTKWKGMAHYNSSAQTAGSGVQIPINVDENVRPYSPYAENSPKARRGTGGKLARKVEEMQTVVGKESVSKKHDTGAKKTDAASSAGRRQRTEELPTRLLKEYAGTPASAYAKSGACHPTLQGRKNRVSHRDGEICLGNGIGLGSGSENHVPRVSAVKCQNYRTRRNDPEDPVQVRTLSSNVSTVRNSTNPDIEGETYGFPCALPTSHMDCSRPSATDANLTMSASTRKVPPAPMPPADDLPYGFLQHPDGSILKMPPSHRTPKMTGP